MYMWKSLLYIVYMYIHVVMYLLFYTVPLLIPNV